MGKEKWKMEKQKRRTSERNHPYVSFILAQHTNKRDVRVKEITHTSLLLVC